MRIRWLGVVLALVLLSVAGAHAQGVTVTVDGRTLSFDQPPSMVGGRVLVPLRGIFEALGAQVRYDVATRTVTAHRGGTEVSLALGGTEAAVNGRPVTLDVPAQSINGRTLVPLRFVSEALGAEVHWDAAQQAVAINSHGAGESAGPPPPHRPPPEPSNPPEITGMVIEPNRPLHAGDLLVVTMSGTPDGRAAFDVEGMQGGVPMQEVNRGTYRGQLRIGAAMRARDARVIGHLNKRGLSALKQSEVAVTVNPPGPAPVGLVLRIVSPPAGRPVQGDFILSARTAPNAAVTVRANVQPGNRTFTFNGQADGNGNVDIEIRTGPLPQHGTIAIEAQAQEGRRTSQWVRVQYRTAR